MEKTIKNLAKAFIGESQARNRYTFFSKQARNDGFEQIAEIFLITADNEKEHAKRIYEHLVELKKQAGDNEPVMAEAEAPVILGSTLENLKSAAEGENYEYTKIYPEFAKIAEEEGLSDIAIRLKAIAKAEEHHEERYKKIIAEVEAGTVFNKDKEVWWVCRECGYVHFGVKPPEECPSCSHPKGFCQVKCEEY